MKGKWWMGKVCTVAIGLTLFLAADVWAETIPKGIHIEGQDLSGMDTEEAKQKIETYVSEKNEKDPSSPDPSVMHDYILFHKEVMQKTHSDFNFYGIRQPV